MDRFEIKKKFQLILNFKRVGQYKTQIEKDNPGYIVEELVNFDKVNNRLYIDYVLSNDKELKILEREQMYIGVGDILEIYTGKVPEVVENFVFGRVDNPGFYEDYLLFRMLEEFDYEEISRDIIDRYDLNQGTGGYIITYYSPEYDLIGINVYRDISLGILYYDLNEKDFIEFKEDPIWIKVFMEEIY